MKATFLWYQTWLWVSPAWALLSVFAFSWASMNYTPWWWLVSEVNKFSVLAEKRRGKSWRSCGPHVSAGVTVIWRTIWWKGFLWLSSPQCVLMRKNFLAAESKKKRLILWEQPSLFSQRLVHIFGLENSYSCKSGGTLISTKHAAEDEGSVICLAGNNVKFWPDDGAKGDITMFMFWDFLTLDMEPGQGRILCYFSRTDLLSQRNLRSWNPSQLNFIVLILRCPIWMFSIMLLIFFGIITDRCCPLAGWLWWSCTATGTTTTRSFCENQRDPLAWDMSCLARGSETETVFILGPTESAGRLTDSYPFFIPCWMVTLLLYLTQNP